MTITDHIQAAVAAALAHIAAAAGHTGAMPAPLLEQPKDPSHGDMACTAALACAKLLQQNPREVAQQLRAALLADATLAPLLASVEIAGPGFINLRLAPAVHQAVVGAVLANAQFGCGALHAGKQVMVEFVSANPTGPLHVGHTRQAALGDALCNLLAAQGAVVTREFYYNDAGNQIANLAASVQLRLNGITPTLPDQFDAQGKPVDNPDWPENGYRGEYIADIARDYAAGAAVGGVTAAKDAKDLDAIRQFAVAYLRNEQDLDLQAFGLAFDVFYLESSLYSEGYVDAAIAALNGSGKTFELDGALWLRTTDFGDDKDRVMRKTDGTYTYFVPDVAYHIQKWRRGFAKVINVQGTDHYGTIARVRAGLQASNVTQSLGIPQGYPDYVLHSMVKVMRGGVEVKISKRAGSYVTMRDLIEWVGRDAVRYFLVSRKADSEFVFDLDLALAKSEENPVYYIQYAHARICSVFAAAPTDTARLQAANTALLTAAKEITLMKRLAQYPAVLQAATSLHAPHTVAHWLREAAADFHSCYNSEKVLVDDTALKHARLALYAATRQVIAHGLALLGMNAPQKM
jgi:arginyl-tRNA synthetase